MGENATEYRLDAQRVDDIFMDCLFREDEETTENVMAEGIVTTVGFHPGRLTGHHDEIATMLAELPKEFHKSSGGGWSFLNACNDRHGNQWTGLHLRMEQLLQLGIASGLAEWQLPRDMWSMLPGGMPYVVVDVA